MVDEPRTLVLGQDVIERFVHQSSDISFWFVCLLLLLLLFCFVFFVCLFVCLFYLSQEIEKLKIIKHWHRSCFQVFKFIFCHNKKNDMTV